VCCSVLQCACSVCCRVLQCVLQCVASGQIPLRIYSMIITISSELQCVAVCCSVLQCAAGCCSVLQCVAVRCSALQCVLQRVAVWADPATNIQYDHHNCI